MLKIAQMPLGDFGLTTYFCPFLMPLGGCQGVERNKYGSQDIRTKVLILASQNEVPMK
jgi:hypothetical protein